MWTIRMRSTLVLLQLKWWFWAAGQDDDLTDDDDDDEEASVLESGLGPDVRTVL